MITILGRLLLALLIGLMLGMSACSHDSDPALGAIQGQLQPVGAAKEVTLTPVKGPTLTLVPDATSGEFTFPNLAPGVYALCAVPATSYYVPDTVKVTVTAGNTSTSTLALVRDGRIRGTMSWKQDGKLYQADDRFYGQVKSDIFSLEGSTAIGTDNSSYSLALVLPQQVRGNATAFQGVGVYPLGIEEYPFAKYSYNVISRGIVFFDQYVSRYTGQAVGEVRITRFDLTTRVASGTFEFTAWPTLTNTGTTIKPMVRITEGQFDITF